MKKIYFILMLISFGLTSIAQVGINNDGTAPDSSAMLDVKSSSKGILIPRMDSTARDTINDPATGLLIFNTSTLTFNYFDGTDWRIIGGTNCLKPDKPVDIFGIDTVCSNDVSIVYSIDPCFGADSYDWQIFSAGTIIGRTDTTFITVNFSSSTVDGYVEVKAINDCGSTNYLEKYIVLLEEIQLTEQPIDQFAINGGNAVFSVSATGDSISYQWQEKVTGSNDFVDLTNGGIYSGVYSNELNLSNVTSDMNGYEYKCLLSNECSEVDTDTATLFVDQYQCGIETVTDADDNVYNTVAIGSQCWLKENLKVGEMINSNTSQSNNQTIEKYCYDDNANNCDVYGGLYQWNELMQYITTSGAQGICPEGWHVPTADEWETMVNYLGGSTGAGGKLKEQGFEHWSSPNTGATNESDFTSLPNGWLNTFGNYLFLGDYGFCFTSTTKSGTESWYTYLSYSSADYFSAYCSKSQALAVRCLKDSN